MPKIVYVRSKPFTREFPLCPPMAFVEVAGRRIDQPICQAADDGAGVPVWAAIVDDETHAAIAAEPEFLGAGLAEVEKNAAEVYALITVQGVADGKGGKVIVPMGQKPEAGAVILSTRPAHTFAGWDPVTGDPAK